MDLYLKIINNSEESLSNMKELNKEFFSKDTLEIAKNLIGKVIEVNNFKARIIEVEAYKQDEASHAFTKTSRSQLMYETYGHVYVYLIYGIYYCLNFTTEKYILVLENYVRLWASIKHIMDQKLERKLKFMMMELNLKLKILKELESQKLKI